MRRHLLTLALAGFFGAFFTATEAQACHRPRCPQPCAVECPPPPPPVCEPCPPPAPRCGLFAHRGGCGHRRLFSGGGLCHRKPACEPAPCPVVYEGPVYAAPQATAQASGQ
jgi:hypothetical protein